MRRKYRKWIYGKHVFRDVFAVVTSASVGRIDVAVVAVVASFESWAVVVI